MRVTEGIVEVTAYHVVRACIVIRRGGSLTEDITLLYKGVRVSLHHGIR